MDRFYIPHSAQILIVGFFLLCCQSKRTVTENRLHKKAEKIILLSEIEKDTLSFGDETGIHFSIKNLDNTAIILTDLQFSLYHSVKYLYFPPNEKMFRKKMVFELDSLTIVDSYDGDLLINIDSNFFAPFQNDLILIVESKLRSLKKKAFLIYAKSKKMELFVKP